MGRQYNTKISERANASLNRRACIVKLEKTIIAAAIIIAISLFILLTSTVHAFADSKNEAPTNKYYTSINIEPGDTLWTIADKYSSNSGMSKSKYIAEIRSINNIGDDIHSGDSIIVTYYSKEVK